MCLPFFNLFVRYDALSRGWCVAYVGDVRMQHSKVKKNNILLEIEIGMLWQILEYI
jgi:hypothetical protein